MSTQQITAILAPETCDYKNVPVGTDVTPCRGLNPGGSCVLTCRTGFTAGGTGSVACPVGGGIVDASRLKCTQSMIPIGRRMYSRSVVAIDTTIISSFGKAARSLPPCPSTHPRITTAFSRHVQRDCGAGECNAGNLCQRPQWRRQLRDDVPFWIPGGGQRDHGVP